MDWLFSVTFWLAISIVQLLFAYVLSPLAKFAIGYVSYMLTGTFITFLIKLRYEIYNEDLRLQPNQIKNRVLLITGASSGIGLVLARHFLSKGFIIVACYYSKSEPGYMELSRLTSSKDQEQQRLYLIELDLRSQESISACYSTVVNILADNTSLQLHALLNVAGVGVLEKFQWTPTEKIRDMVETNLTGPMLMTRQFLHLLIKTPGARVVNVCSPMGIIQFAYSSVYGPTKAALAHFSGNLECDLAKYGVKTVTIQPGNLMQHTAIISSSLSQKMSDTIATLSEEERVLYNDEMIDHQKLLEKVARAYQRNRPFKELRPTRKLGIIVEGGLIEERLEDSVGFLRNFENSVYLLDPPREMFVGNMLYNLIWGSLLQWVPRIVFRDASPIYQSIMKIFW
uniref:Estradiol 17-beta-dehydrogenase 2 n=1 Tax=Aceria tosichella TaxID=561515 RepID=A0A6G1SBB2_9ACAR